nr:hypothetical protein [Tanacetum cinerariifolium]
EGTGSKPGVSDVPSDDSEEELSWKSSDDEEVGSHEEGNESNDDSDDRSDNDSEETVKSGAGKDGDDDDDKDNDDDDEEEETAKDDEEDKETGTGGDEARKNGGESEEEEEETSDHEEGSFDPIPRTPEDSEKESDDEEEQESRFSEEARIQEEEDTEELYRDVNINQGRGLQVTQSVEDTHVILTPVNPDDPQESSSISSFVSSLLNPLSDVGVESIFTTTPSQIVSLEPPTPIMTPSTIAPITTSGEAPIPPPTISSIILENLPTFNSAFRFEERLRLLETSFYEYRQTNQFADATDQLQDSLQRENDEFLRNIDENMKNVLKGLVKNQTDQLQDSLQRENDEFLCNIDENMKNVLKGLVKTQVKEQVSRILPRVEESVNATLEAEVLARSSHSSRTSYVVAADLLEMELKKILIEKMEGNKSIQRSDE